MKPSKPTAQIAGLSLITLGCLLLVVGLVRLAHHHAGHGWTLAAVIIEVLGVILVSTQSGRRR